MTDTQPGAESAGSKDTDWNRQASTFDWEGWIAEENEADAQRAQAKAAAEAEEAAAAARSFPAAQLNYPAPSGPAMAYPAPGTYPPPQGLTQTFVPPPAPTSAYGYSSPDGHPMPQGYAQPDVPFQLRVPTNRPLDVLSVLALIFGILPTIPIGIVLGIVGIVRTANPARRGRGLAVAGLVMALLWAAASVVLPLYLNNHDAPRAAASGQVTKATTISPARLRAGDCYNDSVLGNRTTKGSTNVTSIKVIPCSQPHNAVVYASTTLPAGAWTSTQDKLAIANKQCLPLAKKYFNGNVLDPNLRLGAFAPNETQWGIGFHSSQCVAVDPDKSFTGDIRKDR